METNILTKSEPTIHFLSYENGINVFIRWPSKTDIFAARIVAPTPKKLSHVIFHANLSQFDDIPNEIFTDMMKGCISLSQELDTNPKFRINTIELLNKLAN